MNILAEAIGLLPQLSSWRRDFHEHPELGFKESRTATKLAEIMEGFGFIVRRGVGRTGVVADLGSGSPCIAIRADMDALPIQELNQVEYASCVPGVMHACGHDIHMACALGAAYLLSREKIPGKVRFIFQPSEEVADSEGISGAPRMIADGALDGIEAIIALHVEAFTPCGYIRTKVGPASGGVDSWYGEIIGVGGHGAHPHETIDPFFLTAQVINALNAIVSRRVYPFHPAVISIGSLHGGQTENVIPDKVTLSGTLRYTEKSVQEQIHSEIRRAFEVSTVLGGECNVRFEIGTTPMVNHPQITELVTSVGRELLGEDHVLPWRNELGAEDFGCFMEIIPGTMFTIGTYTSGPKIGLHSANYKPDENCLPVGVAVLTESVIRFLKSNNS